MSFVLLSVIIKFCAKVHFFSDIYKKYGKYIRVDTTISVNYDVNYRQLFFITKIRAESPTKIYKNQRLSLFGAELAPAKQEYHEES